MHLPLGDVHWLELLDNTVVIDAHTASVMAVIARRVENDSRKSMPAHNWGRVDGTK